MELRNKLLQEGTQKEYVARGLTDVNNQEVKEFRKRHFGDNPTLLAKSYSTGVPLYEEIICRYGYGH